jgi:ATP-dependent Clp protease protease subunit
LNSPGGSVYAGLGIYDDAIQSQTLLQFVQEWQLLWNGIVVCRCPGKRSALPHSRVMIHQPSGGAQGVATDMEINLREMLKLKDELYKIISQHSGQTLIKSTKIASVIIG